MPALKHPDWLPMSRVWCLAFSGDGQSLAVGGNFLPSIWDFKTGKLVLDLLGTNDLRCSSISFSPDGERVAATYQDGLVRVWNSQTGRPALAPRKQRGAVPAAAFSPDGLFLAVCRGQEVTIESVRVKEQPTCRTLAAGRPLWGFCFSPDGQSLVALADRELVVWEAASGKIANRVALPPSQQSCSFNPEGSVVVPGKNGLQTWNPFTGHKGVFFAATDAAVAVFSPDGRYLATTAGDSRVSVRNAQTGNLVWNVTVTPDKVRSLAFDRNGRLLAAGGNGLVAVLDVSTRREKYLCRGHLRGNVACVCFSPDGKRLATASSATVCLWDAGNGRELFSMAGRGVQVTAVCFDRDGHRLASCDVNGTVILWDPRGGRKVLSLMTPGGLTGVNFSPDGQFLAACGFDGMIHIWDGRPLPLGH
jgi:WD40 repeat protein